MRFVHEYEVQFNTEVFHFGNLCIEENFGKCHGKFRIRYPDVSVPRYQANERVQGHSLHLI
jgi:hypothetical protein